MLLLLAQPQGEEIDFGTSTARRVKLLRHDNPAVRRKAAQLLAQAPPDEAIAALLLSLRDPSIGVRAAAAEALDAMGDERAVPFLATRLAEERAPGVIVALLLATGSCGKSYVARRLVRFASEDVGNADPQALAIAVAAQQAAHFIGMPEGNTALAQAAIYLATAPKSNAVYTAYGAAASDAERQVAEPVPLHLRNAPTKLMKQLDYGKDYEYAHDAPDSIADMECLPPSLRGQSMARLTP